MSFGVNNYPVVKSISYNNTYTYRYHTIISYHFRIIRSHLCKENQQIKRKCHPSDVTPTKCTWWCVAPAGRGALGEKKMDKWIPSRELKMTIEIPPMFNKRDSFFLRVHFLWLYVWAAKVSVRHSQVHRLVASRWWNWGKAWFMNLLLLWSTLTGGIP